MLEDDIKKEIKRCSRCALCCQNCPIYSVKKDENNTARGLICKLAGLSEGILKKEDLKSGLKICLNCTKCAQNCPSKIDTANIFSYFNASVFPSSINQKFVLFLKFLPVKFLYFINLFNKILKRKDLTEKKDEKILYFKGCMAHAQHKTTFLDKMFNTPKFVCCGLPYLTSGDLKNYKKAKEKNVELIKNAKLVIFDCASCLSAVEKYEELDKKDKEKLIFFTNLDEILNKKLKLKANSKYKNKIVTFHKPCHLSYDEFLKIEKMLSSIENLQYKRLENFDSCCGFGGSYFMFHPIISTLIALKKARTIKNSKADLILTACPSCTLGLRFNQLLSLNFKKTLELRDFINQETIF